MRLSHLTQLALNPLNTWKIFGGTIIYLSTSFHALDASKLVFRETPGLSFRAGRGISLV